MVTCEVSIPGQPPLIASIVYASNFHEEKKDLWKSMVELGAAPLLNGKPWIVLGDFNQILSPEEHSLTFPQELATVLGSLENAS